MESLLAIYPFQWTPMYANCLEVSFQYVPFLFLRLFFLFSVPILLSLVRG